MPGFVPPPHPASTSQGNGQPQFSKLAGLFWPQGDPGKLRQAAQAWREMGSALGAAEGTCHGAASLVAGSSEGPAIDAFARYWSKWEGGGGYFELSAQSCAQMAEALDRYATAIDQARQRVEEIAATAATVLAVGLILTVVTVGISDVAAGAASAGLVAAAAAVGVDLSATVASIGGTILAGAAIGATASAVVDTAIQIEHIDLFHDQRSFNWDELEHSLEIGALTGGAGAGVGLGARAVAPFLEDGLPGFSRAASAFGKMPEWAQAGIRGTVVGGGMAAGIDELTSGQVNPLDVALGATSGALGDLVAGGRPTQETRRPVDSSGYRIQERDLQFLGITREQVQWWAKGEAPLGMTPSQYQDFRSSLLETLQREGIPPDQVDIRLHGSSANFFSGPHKAMPTEADLAGNPEALARLREWFGSDSNRPLARPFDSMLKLGLDEPSDYDLNISSSQMMERAQAWWQANGGQGEVPVGGHGYLTKDVMNQVFPELRDWSVQWSRVLGRDVSQAVFPGTGPWDTSSTGISVHFQETDWIVHRVP